MSGNADHSHAVQRPTCSRFEAEMATPALRTPLLDKRVDELLGDLAAEVVVDEIEGSIELLCGYPHESGRACTGAWSAKRFFRES